MDISAILYLPLHLLRGAVIGFIISFPDLSLELAKGLTADQALDLQMQYHTATEYHVEQSEGMYEIHVWRD